MRALFQPGVAQALQPRRMRRARFARHTTSVAFPAALRFWPSARLRSPPAAVVRSLRPTPHLGLTETKKERGEIGQFSEFLPS